MIFLIIMVFTGISLFEISGLIRKGYWRELIVFSFLLLSAFILSLLQAAGVVITSPMNSIQYLIKDILHLSYK